MVTAIISLFNPNNEVYNNIILVSKQVDRVILVDNSTESNDLFLKLENNNIIYRFMGGNIGIPKAFNSVLKDDTFLWKNDEYIVFFDQDSKIAKAQIETLLNSFKKLSEIVKIGAIEAAYINNDGKKELPHIKKRLFDNIYIVQDLITSSLLTKYYIIQKIGFWNENLFLDGADWDFCWRLRFSGYNCVLETDIPFMHSVGNGIKKNGIIKIRDCKPIRNYYRTRDHLYLIHRKYTPKNLKIRLLFDVIFINLCRLFFLEHRFERAKFILRGFNDYKKGVAGEYSK